MDFKYACHAGFMDRIQDLETVSYMKLLAEDSCAKKKHSDVGRTGMSQGAQSDALSSSGPSSVVAQ